MKSQESTLNTAGITQKDANGSVLSFSPGATSIREAETLLQDEEVLMTPAQDMELSGLSSIMPRLRPPETQWLPTCLQSQPGKEADSEDHRACKGCGRP